MIGYWIPKDSVMRLENVPDVVILPSYRPSRAGNETPVGSDPADVAGVGDYVEAATAIARAVGSTRPAFPGLLAR